MVSIAGASFGESSDGLVVFSGREAKTVFMPMGGYLFVCHSAGRKP